MNINKETDRRTERLLHQRKRIKRAMIFTDIIYRNELHLVATHKLVATKTVKAATTPASCAGGQQALLPLLLLLAPSVTVSPRDHA